MSASIISNRVPPSAGSNIASSSPAAPTVPERAARPLGTEVDAASRASSSAETRPRDNTWSLGGNIFDNVATTLGVGVTSAIAGLIDAVPSSAIGSSIYNAITKSDHRYDIQSTGAAAAWGVLSGPVLPTAGTVLAAILVGIDKLREGISGNPAISTSMKKTLGIGAAVTVANTALLAAGFALGTKLPGKDPLLGPPLLAAIAGALGFSGYQLVAAVHDARISHRDNHQPQP